MAVDLTFQGTLFSSDFLTESITRLAEWKSLDDEAIDAMAAELRDLFGHFPTDQKPNEARTINELIWPILKTLGFEHTLQEVNLTVKGRDDVPDGLLFADADTKSRADSFPEEWKRYEFGLAIVEAKRWNRPLDRRAERKGEELAPSTQMLRYLRRVDDITSGKLRWGILTNGGRWRLYWSGARSVSEQFFDIDLASVLGIAGQGDLLGPQNDEERRHALRLFALIFRREAFLPSTADGRSFHQRAIDEGRFYEERVANDLSNLVFNQVYPLLARSIADADPTADLEEVRQAALILLYRLLFILYAEDRDLLPVKDKRYDDYGLRLRVRLDIGKRIDEADTFSNAAARYWSQLDDLCRSIDKGDTSIGLPPYNGGLFDATRTPLLAKVRLPDTVMADVIDRLSFERKSGEEKRYINYRDLSVQQLGSIYERLLEHEVVREGALVDIRPNIFARKGSGSYYTPDSLVGLIIAETVGPLIEDRLKAFTEKATELGSDEKTEIGRKLAILKKADPAEAILSLKVCDPAMGSGHFLVTLVDYLTDQVIEAMATAEASVQWADDDRPYVSPLVERIETIRETIIGNAEDKKWTVDPEQLDDRHIIRRMVLKRCVYGVDKNVMAVELAKVALWLHSFTVGAPLSFLDHHLHCGDSLFGTWVSKGRELASKYGLPALLDKPMKEAVASAESMRQIEQLADVEIAEAHRSAQIYEGVRSMVEPLDYFLKVVHALQWIDVRGKDNTATLQAFFDGEFGDPFQIAAGRTQPRRPGQSDEDVAIRGQMTPREKLERFNTIWSEISLLIAEERFTNWQVTFPGIWSNLEGDKLNGGFDAIIGNPPWDRMKLQQVEWFAARRREIALEPKADDRKKLIAALEEAGDPLAADYARAKARAEASSQVARNSGDYPLLSGGDINLYSLFVERAHVLTKPDGMIGLLVPIGIGTDKTSSRYVSEVAESNRLKAFISFENRRRWLFKDVHAEDQPTILVAANAGRSFEKIRYAVKLHKLPTEEEDSTVFLDTATLLEVNPNTGTLPIFRSAEDARLVASTYSRVPVFVRKTEDGDECDWGTRYFTMFHMTNDSGLFRSKNELLEKEGAWPIAQSRYQSQAGVWLPLYEGKSVQIYNHRYASIITPPGSLSGQGQSVYSTTEELASPDFTPEPRYWVNTSEVNGLERGYAIGFNDICNTNNTRSLIAAIVPKVAAGNKLPLLDGLNATDCSLLIGNLNSIPSDYFARNKIQSRNLNKYILEQLPVIPPVRYEATRFGSKTAAEIVREAVLELTYTARDMSPFARDMGYVDDGGQVKPPFIWDEERRLVLRAKLDAVFFHLYGITNRDDVRYIYSTFPIVERQEVETYGKYRSCELCLAYISALAAGQPDAEVKV